MKTLRLSDIDGREICVDSENIAYTHEKSGGFHYGLQTTIYLKSGGFIEVRQSTGQIEQMKHVDLP